MNPHIQITLENWDANVFGRIHFSTIHCNSGYAFKTVGKCLLSKLYIYKPIIFPYEKHFISPIMSQVHK